MHPVDGLCNPGGLLDVEAAQPFDRARHLGCEFRWCLRDPQPHDLNCMLEARIVDPVVQAASLQGVVEISGPVRGKDDNRRDLRGKRADLGDGDSGFGEHLEQERLEFLVGAIDLVDEEYRRVRARVLERLEEGSLDEVLAGEQRLLAQAGALRLGNANPEELARVVPFVERLGGVDALEALEADERGVEQFGERLGRLGLADPGLALEQERLGEAHGAEQRGREARLGEVVVIGQPGDERSRVRDLLGEGGHQAFTAVEWDATNESRQPGQQKYQVVPSISA